VLQDALLALAIICNGGSAAIWQRAASAGAAEALVELMSCSSSQDPGVPGMAVQAFRTICISYRADIRQRAADAGAVEALVQRVCNTQHQPDIQASYDSTTGKLSSCSSSRAMLHLSQSRQQQRRRACTAACQQGRGQALLPTVCAVCSRQQKLRLCGSCRAVRYCDADCQRAHWPEHCKECAGGAAAGTS
jgi:hypothetical protein